MGLHGSTQIYTNDMLFNIEIRIPFWLNEKFVCFPKKKQSMENTNEDTNTQPVVLEPTKLIRFPQVKVFTTSGKYEEERCLLIDVINNSGIVDKYSANDNALNTRLI